MKFVTLRLQAFGPFENVSLDLHRPGLHLIYGPNEAGKSSALRAMRQTLYGMDRQSRDAFRHPTNALRLGALLQREDGRTLEFLRRKADKNSLRQADDQGALAEDVLDDWLAGIDEEKFEMMFGIDHAQLRAGGAEIVRGQGKLAETLFAAAGGVVHLQKIQADLGKGYKALYTSGGRNQVIPKKRGELDAARKTLTELQLPSETWRRQRDELSEKESRRAALHSQWLAQKQAHTRLDRCLAAMPILARWKQARLELDALPVTPSLPVDCRTTYEDHVQKCELQRQLAATAQATIEKLTGEVALSPADEIILREDEAIEQLNKRHGAHKKAQQDRAGLVDQLEAARAAIQQQSRVWKDADLTLSPDRKVRLQELGAEQQARSQQCTDRLAERQRWEQRLSELRSRGETLPEPIDTALLRKIVERVRHHGDLAAQIDELTANDTATMSALTARLQRLRFWQGSLDDFVKMAVPGEETIDRFGEEFQQLAAAKQNELRRQKEIAAELARIEEQLQRLELQGTVPTEDDLLAARAARDEQWRRIETALEAGKIPPGTERVTYSVKVRQADEWADRLRSAADRVAQKAGLLLDRTQAAQKVTECERTLSELEQQLAKKQQTWQREWTGLSQPAGTPSEMQRWRQEHTALIEDWNESRAQQSRCEELEQLTVRLTKELDSALGVERASPTLAFALTQAELRLTDNERQRQEHEQHRAAIAHAENELKTSSHQAGAAEQAWQEWRSQWADAVAPLGLTAECSAAEAFAIVEAWDAITQQQQHADQFARRIASIDRDAAQFSADLGALVERICPEESERGVDARMAVLLQRLEAARTIHDQQQALQKELKRQRQLFDTAHRAQLTHEAALDALCQFAGTTRAELGTVIHQAERRRDLDERIRTLEDQLAPLSGGVPLDEFAATVEAMDADAAEGALAVAAREQTATEAALSELDQAIGTARAALQAMQGTSTAADQAETCQLLLTDLQEAAREYTVLRLAAAVLQRGIERYRDRHQGPLLSRASHLFSQLTCESFSGLKSDLRDKGEMIVGVRANGRETIDVTEMSDGTCVQMYLALRLAGLEAWLDHHEPLPFIVDDVLLHFDDDRSTAALRVLAEFSRRTQVLFFTHHDRLRELAERHLPAELLTVHRLAG